jgi:hypothetical protein
MASSRSNHSYRPRLLVPSHWWSISSVEFGDAHISGHSNKHFLLFAEFTACDSFLDTVFSPTIRFFCFSLGRNAYWNCCEETLIPMLHCQLLKVSFVQCFVLKFPTLSLGTHSSRLPIFPVSTALGSSKTSRVCCVQGQKLQGMPISLEM